MNKKFVRYKRGKYHNRRGKLIVADYTYRDPYSKTIIAAGIESGYRRVKDFNRGKRIGYGYHQGTIYKGRRQTTAKRFLNSASKRFNLHVIKHALVYRIVIVDKQAIGVQFILNNKTFTAYNRKEVILSAGAISSPQILMLSGVGPADHLKEFGIPVVKDLAVGENLQDHVAVPVYFKFPPASRGNQRTKQLDDIYRFAIHNDGPFTGVHLLSVAAFCNSVNGSADFYPDYQLAVERKQCGDLGTAYGSDMERSMSGYKDGPTKTTLLEHSTRGDIISVSPVLLYPKSRGSVKLKSASIYDKPIIDFNFFDYKIDMDTMLRALKQQIAAGRTHAYRKRGGKLIDLPLPECDCDHARHSDDWYRCYIRQLSSTIFHPVGTCKMGPHTDPDAVVDHELRVRGIQNLRVVDASVMPTITGANTNGPTIMIAEKGADFIKARWKYKSSFY